MGSGMGGQVDVFDGPSVPLRQVCHRDTTIEVGGHNFSGILVSEILDVRNLGWGVAGKSVLDGDGKVNNLHRKSSFDICVLQLHTTLPQNRCQVGRKGENWLIARDFRDDGASGRNRYVMKTWHNASTSQDMAAYNPVET